MQKKNLKKNIKIIKHIKIIKKKILSYFYLDCSWKTSKNNVVILFNLFFIPQPSQDTIVRFICWCLIIGVIILCLCVTVYTFWPEKKKNNVKKKKVFALEKPITQFFFADYVTYILTIFNVILLGFFYMQEDIVFAPTGWLQIPVTWHWYPIFLVLMVVRILITVAMIYLVDYIKNSSHWTEKKKKNIFHALTATNFFTISLNLSWIKIFYEYLKGSEILSKNWFVGTFRRLLNPYERLKLHEEAVQNWMEKMESSKEVKNLLKNWVLENTQPLLKKYDGGSEVARKYLFEKLESQKEIFQLEELKKTLSKLLEKPDKDPQEFWPWFVEKSINGFNYGIDYFDFSVSEPWVCILSWGLLLEGPLLLALLVTRGATVFNWNEAALITSWVVKWNAISNVIAENEIPDLNEKIEVYSEDTKEVIKEKIEVDCEDMK